MIVLALSMGLGSCGGPAAEVRQADSWIPFSRSELDNGLVLIVHEDERSPLAAVHVAYRVGARDEIDGRRGLAHLVEHLMFTGSRNMDESYNGVLARLGATEVNGRTTHDYTHFHQVVPSSGLDLVLWLESDRMKHLADALTPEKLETQLGIVGNEIRLNQNQPYGQAEALARTFSYPENHPYARPVLGSLPDLEAMTTDDVRDWIETHYGAANAVIVVTGDVETKAVRARVGRLFGDASPGGPMHRLESSLHEFETARRVTVRTNAAAPQVQKVWPSAADGTRSAALMEAVTWTLSIGTGARMRKRLVDDLGVASQARAFHNAGALGNTFGIVATAASGTAAGRLEELIDAEVRQFLRTGPTDAELHRVKTLFRSIHIGRMQRIGAAWGSKADWLIKGELVARDPGHYARVFDWIDGATPSDLREAARAWIAGPGNTITVLPLPEARTEEAGAREGPPEPGPLPALAAPRIDRDVLTNGLELVVVERPELPHVHIAVVLHAGTQDDPPDREGLHRVTIAMLAGATSDLSSAELSTALDRLGVGVQVDGDDALSIVSLDAPSESVEPAFELLASVVSAAVFTDSAFERTVARVGDEMDLERAQPLPAALDLLSRLLRAENPDEASSATTQGVQSLSKLTVSDVREHFRKLFTAGNATIVAVGDIDPARLGHLAQRHLGRWRGGERAPIPDSPSPAQVGGNVYLVDRPGASQSVIVAGVTTPARTGAPADALDLVSQILGRSFSSRINQNLRQRRGWAYGAGSTIRDVGAERQFLVWAAVEPEHTAASVAQLAREVREFSGRRPATEVELSRARREIILAELTRWETNEGGGKALVDLLRQPVPVLAFDSPYAEFEQLSLHDINDAAARSLNADALTWVVVGDATLVRDALAALGIGSIIAVRVDRLDPD